MKKARFTNGMAIDITDDQATKIRFIQNCIRSQRTGQPMIRYYIRDNVKSLAVVHDRNMAETIADTYKRKGHQGVEIIER